MTGKSDSREVRTYLNLCSSSSTFGTSEFTDRSNEFLSDLLNGGTLSSFERFESKSDTIENSYESIVFSRSARVRLWREWLSRREL